MGRSIHILARIVLIDNNHVLLCEKIGNDRSLLPGGHVELDESAASAIRRELQEEFAGKVEITGYICTIEHHYSQSSKMRHEYTLLFDGRLLNYSFPDNPPSLESRLRFFWRPLDMLDEAVLLPLPLREIIPGFAAGEHVKSWFSTMSKTK
jgi:8-oxo-dGTP diphosphatase